MKRLFKVLGFGLLGLLALMAGYMMTQGVYPIWMGVHDHVYQTENDLAIDGYDPVAYFTQEKAVIGKEEFSYRHNGANFHFANQEHLAMFEENPDRFMPEYGGYCAYAVSKGAVAGCHGDLYLMRDGRLYLFSNQEVIDQAQANWDEFTEAADAQWKN